MAFAPFGGNPINLPPKYRNWDDDRALRVTGLEQHHQQVPWCLKTPYEPDSDTHLDLLLRTSILLLSWDWVTKNTSREPTTCLLTSPLAPATGSRLLSYNVTIGVLLQSKRPIYLFGRPKMTPLNGVFGITLTQLNRQLSILIFYLARITTSTTPFMSDLRLVCDSLTPLALLPPLLHQTMMHSICISTVGQITLLFHNTTQLQLA